MSIRTPLIALALTLAAPAWADTRVWVGDLTRGAVATPMRLTITDDAGQLQASLDLPALVYAEEPVAISRAADGGLVVTMPFGLENFDLRRQGERLSGASGNFGITLRPGRPAPYRRETVAFPVAGGSYTGELYTPTDLRRPRGAIVISGGASARGAQVGWNTRSWCDVFARQGMHCLVYPRRLDVGQDGAISTLEQDAADLRAAVQFIASRPHVDHTRLGVFGASRGVWLAVRAAAQDDAIRFLILSAAPATTPSDQEISALTHRMRAAGQSPEAIATAIAYQRLYFSVAHTGQGWDTLAAMVRRAESEPWGEFVDQPRNLDDLAWYHANGEFDPTLDYQALRIPVYAYWGGDDAIVPPAVHRALVQSLLSGNPNAQTAVFPGGDHRGEQRPGPDGEGGWRWFGMAPGLIDGVTAWLAERRFSDPPHGRRR